MVSSCLEREEFIVSDLASISSDYIIFGGGDVSADVVITRSGEENGTKTKVSSKQLVSEKGDMSLPLTVEVRQGIHRYEDPLTKAYITADTADITTLDAWCIYTNNQGKKVSYFKDVEDRKGNNNYIDSIGSHFSKSTDYIFYPVDGLGPYPWETDEGVEFNFYNVAPHGSGFEAIVNSNNNVVTFKYNVPSDASLHKDILVASPQPIGPDDEYFRKPVPLTFKHVMAGVNVKVGTMPQGTIQSIQLEGIYNKGEYKPDSHEWINRSVNDGGVFSVDLTNVLPSDQEFVEGKELYCNFMMIPQTPYTGARLVVTFLPDDGRTEPVTLEASIQGDNWEMNTTTNYIINISENYNISIVPLDETLDSHYIITKVKISSAYPWVLKADAVDTITNSNGTEKKVVDVSVQPEALVNPMAKLGFWTDKKAERDNGVYFVPNNAVSARGDSDCEGSAGNDQIVYVFIPENVTGNTRYITLTVTGGGITKQIVLSQNSVVWMNPSSSGGTDSNNKSDYLGLELLLEGGQVPWGFYWDDYMEFDLRQGGTTKPDGGTIAKGRAEAFIKAIGLLPGIDLNSLTNTNNFVQLHPKAGISGNAGATWFVKIDLSKIGNFNIAQDAINGYQNTSDIYNWNGMTYVSSIIDFLVNWDGVVKSNSDDDLTAEDVKGLNNSLDYAAMYAMKRNRFNLYSETIDGSIIHIPVILDNDLKWYLPAKEQFPLFINKKWGQKFSFNDLFWTSTSYPADTDHQAHSYSYLNGFESITHRKDKYLTFAVRIFTEEVNLNIYINPGDIFIPGDDINEPEDGDTPEANT